MRRPHIVPLSKQALALLNRAAELFGNEGLLFPIVRDPETPRLDNAMSKAPRDMGCRGTPTPHGFRSSFSSMARERSGFAIEVIEKALVHEEKNKRDNLRFEVNMRKKSEHHSDKLKVRSKWPRPKSEESKPLDSSNTILTKSLMLFFKS